MSTIYAVFKETEHYESFLYGVFSDFDAAYKEMIVLAEDKFIDYTSIYKNELDSNDGKAAELVYTCTPVYTSTTIFEKGVARQEHTLTSLDIKYRGK